MAVSMRGPPELAATLIRRPDTIKRFPAIKQIFNHKFAVSEIYFCFNHIISGVDG
jgi:hypothetical protein